MPARRHKRTDDCATRCLTRAYAFGAAVVAALAVLHVALGW